MIRGDRSTRMPLAPAAGGASDEALGAALSEILGSVPVLPRRLLLDTGPVQASVPMLRGVWGAALRDVDAEAYDAVFEGRRSGARQAPLYVLRPAPPDPATAPALDWIVYAGGIEVDASLREAWREAGRRGLGPARIPFSLVRSLALRPDGSATSDGACSPWPLSDASSTPEDGRPLRLQAQVPLRLIAKGRLAQRPCLADIVRAALRRLSVLVPETERERLRWLRPRLIEQAGRCPGGPWQGRRLDLVRYSGRQEAELRLHGVVGHLDLPAPPAVLASLLAALPWLHVGKGTVFGMGQIEVVPADPAAPTSIETPRAEGYRRSGVRG